MEAVLIASGNTVTWVAFDAPDYGGLRSGHMPNTLTNVTVKGQGKLRA